MFSQKILNIFANPNNAGGLQGANGIGKAEDNTNGDVVKIYFKLDEEQQKIETSRFKTYGSVLAIVMSSIATELLEGKTVEEIKQITLQDFLDVVYVEEKDYSYIRLVIEAINNSVVDYEKKQKKLLDNVQ